MKILFTDFIIVMVMTTIVVSTVRGEPQDIFIDALKSSVCTNCHRLANMVGWLDPENDNPLLDAAEAGYDTIYNDKTVCVVNVVQQQQQQQQQSPLVYSLIERSCSINASDQGQNKYITNTGNCGVCSDLHSLGVYIKNIASFERKLFGCGITAIVSLLGDPNFAPDCHGFNINKFSCINEAAQDDFESFYLNIVNGYSGLGTVLNSLRFCIHNQIGLEGDCLEAWKWSVFNTGLLCGFLCVQTAGIPNNVRQPCDLFPAINFCDPDVCQTSINGEHSCYPESYQDDGMVVCPVTIYDGYRLNSCLQCEECNIAYHMNTIMGRIRRTSGLESAIVRPERLVSNITHSYGLEQP
jgi:hypothetical protein